MFPETSVRNYKYSVSNSPEERSSQKALSSYVHLDNEL